MPKGTLFRLSPNANAGGTCLRGEFVSNYKTLAKYFGEAESSDEYKVSGEWTFEDNNGNVFTIYDYKETELYDSSYPSVKQFRKLPEVTFHVGGKGSVKEFIDWLCEKTEGNIK